MEGKFTRFYSRVMKIVGLNGKSNLSDTLVKTFMKIENKKFKISLQVHNTTLETPFNVILGKDFLKGKFYSEDPVKKEFTIGNIKTKVIDVNNIPEIKVAVGEARVSVLKLFFSS
uniref:Uncharacterized protein n=1 Tax=Panagrolaimus superbus TaxID=310955 RepID=A0A914Z9H9_9BILA